MFAVSEVAIEKVDTSRFTTLHEHFKESKDYIHNNCGEILASSGSSTKLGWCVGNNGLVGTIFTAYNNHHNIQLRPEDFWTAVMTQFSLYVNANAEKLRNIFVTHNGKKQLIVQSFGTLRSANYEQLATAMAVQISKNLTDQTIHDWIMPNFTTTTPNDRVVASVVMMSSMQKYFDMKFRLLRGIPNVTLLGTVADYEALADKVDQLPRYDSGTGLMTKWHSLLKPIFTELIAAKSGNPNKDFWSKICDYRMVVLDQVICPVG